MAKITLKRLVSPEDKNQVYPVIFNGKEVGALREGETWEQECNPGQHTLQTGSSAKIYFNIKFEQQSVYFECKCREAGGAIISFLVGLLELFTSSSSIFSLWSDSPRVELVRRLRP